MLEVSKYKEFADDCRKLATSAKNPEHKRQLLEMAAAWEAVNKEQVKLAVEKGDPELR